MSALVAVLVNFGRALRAAGLPVGSGDVLTYCTALVPLDPTDLADLYWAGRVSLVRRRDDIGSYDEVFRAFFLDAGNPVQELLKIKAQTEADLEPVLQIPADQPGEEHEDQAALGLIASDVQTLRHKAFAACTEDELVALNRIMARLRLSPPRRRSRRTRPSATGHRPDLRRTVRESLRSYGEPVALRWRQRRVRTRPLVLILDVSGSMADYSRALLQFAHSTQRACAGRSSARVEVFCFGTRLTCVTRSLRTRSPDDAMQRAARLVLDWDGGTRIGDSIDAFVRGWGRRGMARGAVVVICSDGLDRGDPEVLATAMDRLSRLCHRIVWLNPHKGDDPDYRPRTLGMMVAYPHVDVLLSGHDLASLEKFADLLPTLR